MTLKSGRIGSNCLLQQPVKMNCPLSLVITLFWSLLATAVAQDVCTLSTNFKDDNYPCRKLLHCRELRDWLSLKDELQTKSFDDLLCAIVIDCGNKISISNVDFQAVGGQFSRVLNITISRCNTTQIRLADDMYFVFEVDLNGDAFDSLDFMQNWTSTEFEMLHFYRNRISSVHKSDFAKFYQLLDIRLESNVIVDVEAGCFDRNQQLQSINLANNRIVRLVPDMFRNINRLKLVKLAENKITSLGSGVFFNIHLDSLDLSHNDITTMPSSAFVDTSVVSLNLSHCLIGNILSGFVSSLQLNLTTLDLSYNYIRSLTSDAFVQLSQLRVLYLSGNKLAIVERAMFPQGIAGIHLQSNNLHCCHLLWLQTLLTGKPSIVNVRCVYPFTVQLSQYLHSSFGCSAPEIFPITTTTIDGTSTQATCVASGVPPPNVTLKTDDGVYSADALGGTSVAVNLNVSISLRLPDTDVRKYQLVCVAMNAEGTRQLSLSLSTTIPTKTTRTATISTTTVTTTTTSTTSTTPTTPTTTSTTSTTPSLTTTTTIKTSKETISPGRETTTTSASLSSSSSSPTRVGTPNQYTEDVQATPRYGGLTTETTGRSGDVRKQTGIFWIITGAMVVMTVVSVIIVGFLILRHKRQQNTPSRIGEANNADDGRYSNVPETAAVGGNSTFRTADDNQHFGDVGGQSQAHIYAEPYSRDMAEPVYMKLDTINKAHGADESENGRLDVATGSKEIPPPAKDGRNSSKHNVHKNRYADMATDSKANDPSYESLERWPISDKSTPYESLGRRQSPNTDTSHRPLEHQSDPDIPQEPRELGTGPDNTTHYETIQRRPTPASESPYTDLR